MHGVCTQAYLKLGLLGALVFFCSNSFLWRSVGKGWKVTCPRPPWWNEGSWRSFGYFFQAASAASRSPASGIKPGLAGLAAGRSFPPKPAWFQYHPRGCKAP